MFITADRLHYLKRWQQHIIPNIRDIKQSRFLYFRTKLLDMRSTIFLLFFFLLSINCHAEGAVKLAFSPSDSLNKAAQLPGGNGSIIVNQWVKNISGGNIIVKWNVAGYGGEGGWDFKICATDSCFNFPPPAAFPEVPLAAGDSVELIWEVIPYTQTGTGNCTCNFWVKGDSAQSNVRNFLKVDATQVSGNQNIPSIQYLRLYPNPVRTKLNIDFSLEADDVFSIVNISGQEVMQTHSQSQIDVANLQSGNYQLIVKRRNKIIGTSNFQR